jgi:sulfate permease, SulP family
MSRTVMRPEGRSARSAAAAGRVPGDPHVYSDLSRHPRNRPTPGVLIVHLDGPFYYANALTVRDRVRAMITEAPVPPRAVVFDAAAQDALDVTSAEILRDFLVGLRRDGIEVYFADVHTPMQKRARELGLDEVVSDEHVLPTVDAAVRRAEAGG